MKEQNLLKGTVQVQKALKSFIKEKDELTASLAEVLLAGFEAFSIDFDQIQHSCGEQAEDVVLVGWEWRLLLPVRAARCAEWDDRILMVSPGETYEMVNLVREMIAIAGRTGEWRPGEALASFFHRMEDPDWGRIPDLVYLMGLNAVRHLVSVEQIQALCREMGLEARVDGLIASLKAAGAMSPSLGDFARILKTDSPLYELNPSLMPLYRADPAKDSL